MHRSTTFSLGLWAMHIAYVSINFCAGLQVHVNSINLHKN